LKILFYISAIENKIVYVGLQITNILNKVF
jgi:hypothetical protein